LKSESISKEPRNLKQIYNVKASAKKNKDELFEQIKVFQFRFYSLKSRKVVIIRFEIHKVMHKHRSNKKRMLPSHYSALEKAFSIFWHLTTSLLIWKDK
jgi:thermostable 8-oxoguanine DNA glycosylase